MTRDIIEKLRSESGVDKMGNWQNRTLRDAAAEIERLRTEAAKAREALAWERCHGRYIAR